MDEDHDLKAYAELERIYGQPEADDVDLFDDRPADAAPVEQKPAEPAFDPEKLKTDYENVKGAMLSERAQRKELAEKLRAAEEERQKIQAVFEEYQRRAQPVDEIDQLKSEVQRLRDIEMERQQAAEVERTTRQIISTVQSQEDRFLKTAPDYFEACEYLIANRQSELQSMFPDTEYGYQLARRNGFGDPATLRAAVLEQDRLGIAMQAIQSGQEAPAIFYNLAKSRGYQPKSSQPAQPQKPSIEQVRDAAKAAGSLSAGGAGREGPISTDALAEMFLEDPERASKLMDKMGRAGRL